MSPADLPARVAGVAALAALAVLDQPLRLRLYELLAERRDWVGRDEAAEALGLPRSVAAFHLDKLAGAGLVDVRYERPAGRGGPGAGRPAKRYRRSDREVTVSLPERRYDLASAVLADAVAEATASGRPVAEAVADAARATGRTVAESLGGPAGRGRAGALRAAVAALRDLGYEPREQGGEVILDNCPFHALAERHRELVCGLNLHLLTGVADGLGAGDRLAAALRPEPGACCVRLSARGAGPS
ncbi:MAG TPA: helix-turn-helix domain-containing protein [Frankiaceae bacterium]|nr:helix-turn-helix domain-containing protein [Frankiaceae bacterium]